MNVLNYPRLIVVGSSLLVNAAAWSVQGIDEPVESIEPQRSQSLKSEFVAVPFIFSTETLSTAAGGAGVLKHAGQAQASVLAVGLGSANDSWVTYLAANSYQLPKLEQWLFSAEFYRASYKQGIYFIDTDRGESMLAANQPSSGQLTETERVITLGDESYAKLHMKYVLPWGRGVNGATKSLVPATEALSWNPLTSGVSSLTVTPFYRMQQLQGYDYLPNESQGVALQLGWDNRDNGQNSTQGGQTRLTLTRDFGSASRSSWTTWEFEQSLFLSLGQSDWFAKKVLAFNLYLADTPTWKSGNLDTGEYHRPPSFVGVSLGGFNKLRGYAGHQFAGRSAVLYSAEYRMQPKWQPLTTLPLFNLYHIPWWQWTLFAETGQVSDEFTVESLHQDMKWTLGAGVRFEVEGVVVRTDFAVSEQGGQFWVMVNQPF
ncbi:hypothetical protein TUM4644_04180 [Shewanella colwelliana]|uniref:hypothetical protein n=1 Tax=Shewanella colwelliana TaxID=23 RepID=UPI001BC0A7D2|nr:hypothetical protein [Shewanella colwelliana]GIU18104.1 hypothetical protein TUM4644_04180 [Shewanella colwelliana]